MDDDRVTDALRAVRKRRRELHEAIVDIEQALAGPAPGRVADWARGVISEIDDMRAALLSHIDVTEGEDGLFEEVLDRAPRLAHRVEQLRSDHEAIRAATEQASTCLLSVTGEEHIAPARDSVLALLGLLVRHRHLGADLVYEAYSVDVGAAD